MLNIFRATMCPSSGADDSVVLSPRVGVVPWLQEGCQKRLAGSVSTGEFVAQLRAPQWNRLASIVSTGEFIAWIPQWTRYLLTGSDSLPAATAQHQHVVITLCSHQLLKMGTQLPETCWATSKGEVKDNTKMTSSWFSYPHWITVHGQPHIRFTTTADLQTFLEAFYKHVPEIYLFHWWSFFCKKQKFHSWVYSPQVLIRISIL